MFKYKLWKQNIKRWFSYYKVVSKIYDFDYSSILEVEEHQLRRVRKCIHNTEKLDLALKLLHIIKEGGVAKTTGDLFTFVPIDNDLYALKRNPDSHWTIDVYVNTRNYKRFWPQYELDTTEEALRKDMLRVEKAWYLYHKLRLYYLRQWWD